MAEQLLDLRDLERSEAYRQLAASIDAVLEGIQDEVTAMATMSSLIHHAFGHLWTGFYRVVEPGTLLRVGPYQGTLGCLEIHFGEGVCGSVASRGETIIVPDVEQFPGHIACDARARSEIVVPVRGERAELVAVLDIDSEHLDAFDERDRLGLERIVGWFGRGLS